MPTPNRDQEHLAKLRDFFADSRRIPSNPRIGELIGISKPAARKFMERLERHGFVERTPDDDAWIPGRRFFEHALTEDTVRAGMPTMARDVSTTPFYFDEYLVREPSRTVLIPVRGDSMSDAHIDDGDLAVVERGTAGSVGDFVVAIVDGDFTLKELVLEKGRFALKPHNPSYPLIVPKADLEIFGVMVGLVRRFQS